MRLIPVIDLKSGQVVHGKGGRRDEYQPIVSSLAAGSTPVDMARALIEGFQPQELYLADLDAIAGALPAWEIYAELSQFGVDLWIDAGIRRREDVRNIIVGSAGIICGLESLQGPEVLSELVGELGADRLLFSLDLSEGQLLGDLSRWPARDRWDVEAFLETAIEKGIRRFIVLDLSRVGEARGIGTEQLCRRIVAGYPQVELFAGGGIRGEEDLMRLADCGVAGALVASALHDGRIKTLSQKTLP